jgi:RNA 3'-terminal phosphate cyclase (ATP)
MSDAWITIDGSEGEGGGQILRSSLALAAITARPVRFINIRAKRRKPGLLRQHLTAVRAAGTIACAELVGDELGSGELEFRPGVVTHGEHHFAVGSAGSATLVFQTVLWPLLVTPGRSRLVFEGGTHNPMAPPFEFLARAFLPVLHRLGLSVEARLEQAGFYPAGGGRFVVDLVGGQTPAPLQLDTRGPIRRREARALVAQLPAKIGVRELAVVEAELGWSWTECRVVELEGRGPGNALCLIVEAEHATEVVTGFGARGVPAERVAAGAVAELRAWLDADVPVGEHLADQLLIPIALAALADPEARPSFVGTRPSLHTTTNAGIIARFLPVAFEFEDLDPRRTRVTARRRAVDPEPPAA